MVAPGAPGYPKKVFIQIGLLGRLKLRELLGYVAFKFVAHTIEPVNIVGNRLEGNIPKELANLQALKKLDLNRIPLGRVITPTVRGLNAQEELNLGWITHESVPPYGHARTVQPPAPRWQPPQFAGYDASKRVSIQTELLGRLKLRELLGYAAFKFVAHTIQPVNIVGNKLEATSPRSSRSFRA